MSGKQTKTNVLILGGGLTGLSAAWHLQDVDHIILEQAPSVGGLAATDNVDGFLFDRGSHVWYTSNHEVDTFVKSLPGVSLKVHQRSAWVHAYDRRIPAPFQGNLFGMPLNVVSDCLTGFCQRTTGQVENFADWLLAAFGAGFYNHFMRPYNTKVWTVSPEELTIDWQNSRVDTPDPRQIIDGAIGLQENRLGENATFYYPQSGGSGSIVSALANGCHSVRCNSNIHRIDPDSKTVYLREDSIRYNSLISTIPLHSLVRLISPPESDVVSAADGLACTKVLLVNIALSRRPGHGFHWIYFPEEKYPYFRVSFPHNYADDICPPGCGSIQAECAFRWDEDVDTDATVASVIRTLAEAEYLEESSISFVNTKLIGPAYVLYDHQRRQNLEIITQSLYSRDVHVAGRFGAWEYINMDACIAAGRNVAACVRRTIDG